MSTFSSTIFSSFVLIIIILVFIVIIRFDKLFSTWNESLMYITIILRLRAYTATPETKRVSGTRNIRNTKKYMYIYKVKFDSQRNGRYFERSRISSITMATVLQCFALLCACCIDTTFSHFELKNVAYSKKNVIKLGVPRQHLPRVIGGQWYLFWLCPHRFWEISVDKGRPRCKIPNTWNRSFCKIRRLW